MYFLRFSTLSAILFLAASALASGSAVLVLSDASGRTLFSQVIDPDCGFAIRYTHSVAQSPVTDYFTIKGAEISLDKTVYHDFGAGLPHCAEKGQKMSFDGGKLIISGYDRKFPAFDVRVGRVARHALLILAKEAGKPKILKEIPLDAISPPGAAITFRAVVK